MRKPIFGRFRRGYAAALLLTLIAALAVSSPAAAASGPSNIGAQALAEAGVPYLVQLRNWNTNETKCMGVEGGRPMNGSRVVLWTCGSSDHWWTVDLSGDYNVIRNYNDFSKCLGVVGGIHDAGAQLVTYDCDGSANQNWRTEDSSECGGVTLVNQNRRSLTDPYKLASVAGRETHDGASVVQWPHGSSPDQTWCIWA